MNNKKEETLSAKSVWLVAGDRDILDVFTVKICPSKSTKDIADADLDEIVKEDGCLCLLPAENESKSGPEITISVSQMYTICKIHIVSEAGAIEVYGSELEYLQTSHSMFVDDWEGMAVYQTNIEQESTNLTLKFLKLKDSSRLWMYGVLVKVLKAEIEEKPKFFDFRHVGNILDGSSCTLSKQAENCMKFLELYPTLSKSNSVSIDKNFIFNYLSKINEGEKENSSQIFNLRENEKRSSEIEKETIQTSQFIKTYIDMKCEALEKNLIEHFNKMFHEFEVRQNKRLDDIVKLLSHNKNLPKND